MKDKAANPPKPQAVASRFPERPKPPLDLPVPFGGDQASPPTSPSPLVGNLPSLPSTSPDVAATGPLAPNVAAKLPIADLNADEALAKRLVIGAGGDIVSVSDAKDGSGKVGRSLVAETGPERVKALEGSLRASLHDRVVISDAGTVGGSTPELEKAEEGLATAEKARDRARVDFLPQAPILRQIEDDYARMQQSVAAIRKRIARRRINVMIRPGLNLP